MIRFIHCADLHLGRAFQTAAGMDDAFIKKAANASFESFGKIMTEAVERQVDFVVISGDVYDKKDRSLKAQWFIKQQADWLREHGIQLYIIHGNHDPLIQKDSMIRMPENVHVFSTEVSYKIHETKDGTKAVIYGFSYPETAYTENPLPAFCKTEENNAYHIGLLHGQESGQKQHDPYAPFSLSELSEKDFDYWALGHVHQRQILKSDPAVVYPGNIQGCHRKETGPKGAYMVELSSKGTDLTFIETSPVIWTTVTASINELETVNALMEKISSQTDLLAEDRHCMLTVVITGTGILHHELALLVNREEIAAMIHEEISQDKVWVDHIDFRTSPDVEREKWRKQEHLAGDVVRLRENLSGNEDWKEAVAELTHHRKIRPFLHRMDEEAEAAILDEAEKLILSALQQGGKK